MNTSYLMNHAWWPVNNIYSFLWLNIILKLTGELWILGRYAPAQRAINRKKPPTPVLQTGLARCRAILLSSLFLGLGWDVNLMLVALLLLFLFWCYIYFFRYVLITSQHPSCFQWVCSHSGYFFNISLIL